MVKETFRKIYNKKDVERQEKLLHSIRTLYIPKQEFQKVYKLLSDLDFLDIKTNHCQYKIQELIEDFNAITSQIGSSSNLSEEQIQALQIIRDALVLSVDILEKNPDQLVAQLLGRLMYFTQPEIVRLVKQVENHPAPYLVPRNSVLTPPTQKLVRTLQGHEDSKVTALITVPFTQEFEQSFLIVSGGEDQQIKVWDGLSGNLYQTLDDHEDSVTALISTQDGKYIFSGSANGEVIIWQVNLIDEQKIEIKPLHSEVLPHDDSIKALAISADQKLLFVAAGQKIYIYEWQSNNLVVTLKGHTGTINCLLCDRANQNLYSGSDDGLIYIWDMRNYQHIGTLKPKPERNEEYRERMAGKLNSVLSMCLIDSNTIAVMCVDLIIHEFDISKQKEIRNKSLPFTISSETYENPTSGYIYALSDDYLETNVAIAIDNSFAVGKNTEYFKRNKSNVYNSIHNNIISVFCISPDKKYAVSGEKEIKIWRVSTAIENEIVVTPSHNKSVTHIQIASDKNICISASDGFLRTWNLSTLGELWDENVYDLKEIIFPREDNDIFAILSKDRSVGFNTDNGEVVFLQQWDSSYTLPRIFLKVSDIIDLKVNDTIDGSIFAFTSNEKFAFTMRIDGQLVTLHRGSHLNKITCLTVSPIQVASGSDDGIIQIVDLKENNGTIYLANGVSPRDIAFVYYNRRLLTWLSDDSIVIYDGLIDEEDLEKNLDNINSIFKTKGSGYQIANSEEYIIPISKERRAVAIYRQYEDNESFIEVRELEFGDFLQRIRVDVPNLVSWQFDIDFDDSERYLIGIYDPSSKLESNPVAKNLIVWDLRTKKKCCEFVNDLEITSYKMSSKLESVIVGDAGGRLHFLQFTSEHTESIDLYLYRTLNPEYQKALKSMIDLDSKVYEAPRLIEKHFNTDKLYEDAITNFFKSIFYLFKFNYPKFIENIKKSGGDINFASDTDKLREKFDDENLDNIEIVLSYDSNNHEAYWIKGQIYLKRAKSFFDKKLYKEGMQAAFKARSVLSKAETLSEKSSKINDAVFTAISEAIELDYKCFFWQPITEMSESFDHPLETESDIRAALRITNSMIDSIVASSRYANIPDLLARAYMYQANLNLMLENDTEALEACDLVLENKPNGGISIAVYKMMTDIYKKQNSVESSANYTKLSKTFRQHLKSIDNHNMSKYSWAWRNQYSYAVWESLWSWGKQWENNKYMDDRLRFFMVKIVTPIRVFLYYAIPLAVLIYFLYSMTNLITMIYEYISYLLGALNKK
jgi:WD40 repeat protein